MFGLPESGLAETLRDAEEGIDGLRRRSRSPPACAAARSRWSRATSRERPTCTTELVALLARAPRARDLLRGRLEHRRPGGCSCWRGAGWRRRSRAPRAAGGAADRAPGVVRVRRGRRGGLRQRGEGGAARRGPGADRATRRGVRAGGRGDGRGRAARASRPTRRWRSRASRARTAEPRRSRSGTVCWSVQARRRPRDHAHDAAAGRPSRHPRPLDDRRDAPAAPRAAPS